MRIRPDKYYVIHVQRGKEVLTVEVDETDSEEIVYLVCSTFPERLSPTKEMNGKYKKGLPYSMLSVTEYDKVKRQTHKLTSGRIYNLSPTQIKERLKKKLSSN